MTDVSTMRDAYLSVWPPEEPTSTSTNRSWPKISIVTPNFNEDRTLERTILSVTAQRYPALEYIVMDDGSSDRSVEIISRHAKDLAHWSTHANCGQYATINRGFSMATGDIFGWLNSDDVYLPWTLRAVADVFTTFPSVDWIMGLPSTIQNGVVYRVRDCRAYPQDLLRWGLFHGPPLGVVQQESCFWRRSLWNAAGPLDETFRRAADFELWTRFARHAPLVCGDMLLTGFTRTGKNRSIVQGQAYLDEVDLIQRSVNDRLPRTEQAQRRQAARRLDCYRRTQKFSSARSMIARLCGLGRYQGPTVRRDFQGQQSIFKTEPLFAA